MEKLSEEELALRIEDIIQSNVFIEDVPYSLDDGAKQVSQESRVTAAMEIVKFLKTQNILK